MFDVCQYMRTGSLSSLPLFNIRYTRIRENYFENVHVNSPQHNQINSFGGMILRAIAGGGCFHGWKDFFIPTH